MATRECDEEKCNCNNDECCCNRCHIKMGNKLTCVSKSNGRSIACSFCIAGVFLIPALPFIIGMFIAQFTSDKTSCNEPNNLSGPIHADDYFEFATIEKKSGLTNKYGIEMQRSDSNLNNGTNIGFPGMIYSPCLQDLFFTTWRLYTYGGNNTMSSTMTIQNLRDDRRVLQFRNCNNRAKYDIIENGYKVFQDIDFDSCYVVLPGHGKLHPTMPPESSLYFINRSKVGDNYIDEFNVFIMNSNRSVNMSDKIHYMTFKTINSSSLVIRWQIKYVNIFDEPIDPFLLQNLLTYLTTDFLFSQSGFCIAIDIIGFISTLISFASVVSILLVVACHELSDKIQLRRQEKERLLSNFPLSNTNEKLIEKDDEKDENTAIEMHHINTTINVPSDGNDERSLMLTNNRDDTNNDS